MSGLGSTSAKQGIFYTLEEIRVRAEYITSDERGGGNIILDAIVNNHGNRLLRALLFSSLEGGEA